jgi:hypothetical protein
VYIHLFFCWNVHTRLIITLQDSFRQVISRNFALSLMVYAMSLTRFYLILKKSFSHLVAITCGEVGDLYFCSMSTSSVLVYMNLYVLAVSDIN